MRVGVLAIQGGFAEHISHLKKAGVALAEKELEVVEVRTAEELDCCDALVIPGGESTCMAHICKTNDLLEPLRDFCSTRPVWGTCAGMIFLAKSIQGSKEGGQLLIGNMDITVNRNFFGNQVHSFETSMATPGSHFDEINSKVHGGDTFRAVFIRAPAIIMSDNEEQEKGKGEVEYISILRLDEPASLGEGQTVSRVAVAAKQNHILVTAFHPELTSDIRWHALFVQMARDHCGAGGKVQGAVKEFPKAPLPLADIPDMPILC
ncbi:subunit PdxT of pyridoxal 5'-phosphate synthase [Chloropicon primus]|uniref:Subunit PdxT of pyridoxal 5'-phosphate synthase n=1 Tax=Chloropicon primus TaxID=1764295 RepID=A0A5B8N2B6_9CHLO|nr:subunit PdxT of pyridoxal 5'-phosphate synthase [Chloropicon primus]UPR05206.1 subunit PdxT of pyridoxal 5'-phosphate synthase [Chloropicon primus]|mmetsp:Transcript_1998/g.5443  ORF Transcript_1998/g.5443 Transcript_1998/m.5443 type:complete len:263 (+) Transcript_1998:73-861(+)|eukprot:QDZ26005.1 subunit PdxT of pyridoxal 5'-phosphate synthase [Chloropicon primus]